MTDRVAKNITKRLIASIIIVVLLIAALGVTTFVLIGQTFTADGSGTFGTGKVQIDLNGGKPVISDLSGTFAPGKKITRSFTIENLGDCDVWYKFYFSETDETLAKNVTVEIKSGEYVLMKGDMSDFTEEKAVAVDDLLKKGEKKTLSISFSPNFSGGSALNGRTLRFTFNAKAAQAKNNPDKKFD